MQENLYSALAHHLYNQKVPIQTIHHLRITKACSLLQNTDLKISEIASRVGISNCSLFCKTFKEITDITPSEYRRIPTISEPKPNLKHKQVSGESSIPKTFP